MGIKVVTTARGYHGHFREPGETFELEHASEFEPSWMECEHRDDAEKITTFRNKVAEQEAKVATDAKQKGVPVVQPASVRPARVAAKGATPQTTGNNVIGGKPYAGADTLPQNDLT